MKITGTIVNYYIYCKRKCCLFAKKINLEDNSEEVLIGRVLHELKAEINNNTEITIDSVKIDRISKNYITEYKKKDTDVDSCKWQLIYYIYIMENRGLSRKGRLCFNDARDKKTVEIVLTEELRIELKELLDQIKCFLDNEQIPAPLNNKKCRKCAYDSYCKI